MKMHSVYTKLKSVKIIYIVTILCLFSQIGLSIDSTYSSSCGVNNPNYDKDMCDLEKKLKVQALNSDSKSTCDDAKSTLASLKTTIGDHSCPDGMSVEKCMSAASECADQVDSGLSSAGATLGGLTSLAGSMLNSGSGFSGISGLNNSAPVNKCGLTRDTFDKQNANKVQLDQQRTDAENNLRNSIKDARQTISDAQQSQLGKLSQVSKSVADFKNADQSSTDDINNLQNTYIRSARGNAEAYLDLNNKMVTAQEELSQSIIDQQNLSVKYVNICSNQIKISKTAAVAQLNDPANQAGKSINQIALDKQNIVQQLRDTYNTCMEKNNQDYQAEFASKKAEISAKQKNLDLLKLQVSNSRANLATDSLEVAQQTASRANKNSITLEDQRNQIGLQQQAVMTDANTIATMTQQMQKMQTQLDQQVMMNQLANSGAGNLFGITQSMSAGNTINAPFVGLGSAVAYSNEYEAALQASKDACGVYYNSIKSIMHGQK